MKNILSIIMFTLLLSCISFAQQLNIHTTTGTDAYNLVDIDSITFTVPEDTSTSGTVTDIDGNVYQTVKIGNQWWMAENLKVTHYRNGDVIPNVEDDGTWGGLSTGAYCAFNNSNANIETYGLLYNWYAVGDSRILAPQGWHMPSDEEWKQLEMYLGMSQSEADGINWRGTDEGGKLKETGLTHWNSPNLGATNKSGFTALPSGYRNYSSGAYTNLGGTTDWWAADSLTSWRRGLNSNNSDIARTSYNKRAGFSVRCVKD